MRRSVVLVSFLAVACAEQSADLEIRPDSPVFNRTAEAGDPTVLDATASFRVLNRGDENAYAPACGSEVEVPLYRLAEGGWIRYTNGACPSSLLGGVVRIGKNRPRIGFASIQDAGTYRVQIEYVNESNQRFFAASDNFQVR
jgi:hypothetical protein